MASNPLQNAEIFAIFYETTRLLFFADILDDFTNFFDILANALNGIATNQNQRGNHRREYFLHTSPKKIIDVA